MLLGVWADLGALTSAIVLVPTAVLMHAFWKETAPMSRTSEQVHFLKDVSMAGASLIRFALIAHVGTDLGLTLTGPLFDL